MPEGLIPDFDRDQPIVLGDKLKKGNDGAFWPEGYLEEIKGLKIHPHTINAFMCWNEIEAAHEVMYGNSDGGEMEIFREVRSDCKNLLDVGAMHGFFSFLFTYGRPENKCLAVDPSSPAIGYLNYNIKINKMEDQIIVEEKALSNKVGKLKMTDDPQWKHDHVRHAGVTDEGIDLWKGDGTPRDYKCITGDELCKEHNFIPDFIKIDVEGHEVKVLEGCRGLIEKHKPTILCEIHAGTGFLAVEKGELNVFRQILEPLDYDMIYASGGPFGWNKTFGGEYLSKSWEGFNHGDKMPWYSLNLIQQQMETRYWHLYNLTKEKYVSHDTLSDMRILFKPR